MSKINIEEILERHLPLVKWPQPLLIAAIKEIVEEVVDRCVEEAEVEYFNEYYDNESTCVHSVKEESILKVKEEVDYG